MAKKPPVFLPYLRKSMAFSQASLIVRRPWRDGLRNGVF